jgi:uncharacterized protein YwgA
MIRLLDNDKEKLEGDIKYIGGIIKRVSNFDMSNLEGRLIFQKTIYLIQAFNVNLGYKFNWYLKGVYSPRLADVGYKLKDNLNEIPTSKFSEPEIEEKFQKFLKFIEPYKNDATMLEVFSSLHWFKRRNPDLNKDVYIDMITHEKNIDLDIIEEGWRILSGENII